MLTKILSGLQRGIVALIDRVGQATVWIGLAMIALVTVNVLLRYAFSLGSVWAQELEWHLLAALIMLGMGYALQRGDNVRVDLFYVHFSARTRRLVDLVSLLLLLAISLYFIKLAWSYVGQSYAIAEGSPDPGGIPYRWVVKSLIVLGYGLVALQCLGQLLGLWRPSGADGEARHD